MSEKSWIDRYLQAPPVEKRPVVEREPVADMSCPICGSTDIKRYPVANEHGARIATKCQACLHTLVVERPGPDDWWPPYRSLTYDWKASIAERASRALLNSSRGVQHPTEKERPR